MCWIVDRLSRWMTGRRERREIRRRVELGQARRRQMLADPDLSPLDRLLGWWGTASPGVSDTELNELERRYAVRLPDDFRSYLKAAMPAGNEWDSEGTRWWPLRDIKSIRDECSSESGYEAAADDEQQLIFADYLIWCHAWAVDCSNGADRGKILIVSDASRYVADSFDEFLDRYIRDDSSIY
jgi:hypothetical protein